MKSVAQARKFFYDYLDNTRPWAKPNVNVYEMMEEMVNKATVYFTDERVASVEEVDKLTAYLERFTADLTEHPEGYAGPCQCAECLQNG